MNMISKASVLSQLDSISVLVVGDLMLDRYWYGDVRRVSPEAPVPVVEMKREVDGLGGSGNVAANLASLGIKAEVIGVIGDDITGQILRDKLAEIGVLYNFRRWGNKGRTTLKTRVLAQGQQICRIDWESQNKLGLIDSDLDLDYLESRVRLHDAVIVSDYAKGCVSQRVIDRILKASSQSKIFLAFDPKPGRMLDFSGFDLITPNRNEALQLVAGMNQSSNNEDLDLVSDIIMRRWKLRNLVITLGEDGIYLKSGSGEKVLLPTVAKEVFDVSGAGDTVIAVLTALMASGVDAPTAVQLANRAAGIVVGKVGTATVSRSELFD